MHPALEDEEEIQVCTECQGSNQIIRKLQKKQVAIDEK